MDRDESGEVIERANMSLMDRVISFTASFIDVAPTGYHEGKIRETTVLLVKRALWHEARAGFGPEQFDRWCTQDVVSADRLRRAGFRLDRSTTTSVNKTRKRETMSQVWIQMAS